MPSPRRRRARGRREIFDIAAKGKSGKRESGKLGSQGGRLWALGSGEEGRSPRSAESNLIQANPTVETVGGGGLVAKAILDQAGRGCGWSGPSALAGIGWKTLGVAPGWYEAGPLALREQSIANYRQCWPGGAVKVRPAESNLSAEKSDRIEINPRKGRQGRKGRKGRAEKTTKTA
jgi:hypothetical protein